MNDSYLSDKGLTLIEILAAVAILGIVTTYFYSFFTQSIIFSGKIEDKITAIDVAENVLNDVKNNNANIDAPRIVNGKFYYPNITFPDGTTEENQLNLKRVDVKIYMNQNYTQSSNPISEVYGYIKTGG